MDSIIVKAEFRLLLTFIDDHSKSLARVQDYHGSIVMVSHEECTEVIVLHIEEGHSHSAKET